MFRIRGHRSDHDLVESLSGAPSGEMAHGWVYGVFGALIPAGIGAYDVVMQKGWMLASRGRSLTFVRVEGPAAVWLGCALISLALVLHFHWFWGNHPRLGRYYEPAKFLALVATFIATVGFIVHFTRLLGVFR